jgi:predicted transcriptional regulator
MKAIRILIDERLLKRLDADEEVQRDGRSAVLRRAAAEYLKRRRSVAVVGAYRRAYSGRNVPGGEFMRWADEGVWPDE